MLMVVLIGIMTNFKYFNRALSPEEIYIMYNKSYDDRISISNIPRLININNILNGILPD